MQRVAPVLAVEGGGEDESEADLRDKVRWYLDHEVGHVWLVLPTTREVVVIDRQGETRYTATDRLAAIPSLPDLTPAVRDFFAQLDRAQP